MEDEQQKRGEASVHAERASSETRAYAAEVLAPLGVEESEQAARRALEAVMADDALLADEWTVETSQGKHRLDPASSRKFRIRDLVSAVARCIGWSL